MSLSQRVFRRHHHGRRRRHRGGRGMWRQPSPWFGDDQDSDDQDDDGEYEFEGEGPEEARQTGRWIRQGETIIVLGI
jgi:hypothetical protein